LTRTQSKGRRPNESGSRQQKGDPAQATRQASGCLRRCGSHSGKATPPPAAQRAQEHAGTA